MRLATVDASIQAKIDALDGTESLDYIAGVATAARTSDSSFDRSNLFRCIHLAVSALGANPSESDAATANTVQKIAAGITPRWFGHGPVNLVAGDMWAGYFGEVSGADLFLGDDLALALSVDEGTLQNSAAGWLKFAWRGQIVYIAKQSFMHSVTWDHLYARGVVYGTDDNGLYPRGTATNQYTTVEKDNFEYVVQMMTGAASDPIDTTYRAETWSGTLGMGAGSMWNDLMYRVCADIPTIPNGREYDGGAQVGDNWAGFTTTELNITSGDGRYTWCQEAASEATSYRVYRGYYRLSGFFRITASHVSANLGWRPCLVLKS